MNDKVGLEITEEEIENYLSDKIPQKGQKNNKKPNKKKKNDDDDILDNMVSQRTLSEKLRKHLTKRVVMVIFLIPFAIMLGIVLVKTWFLIQNSSKRVVAKTEKKEENLGLTVKKEYDWKILKEQQIKNISKEVVNLKKEMKSDLNTTLRKVEEQNKNMQKFVIEKIDKLEKIIVDNNKQVNNQIKMLAKNDKKLEEKIKQQKGLIVSKLNRLKESGTEEKDSLEISLPALPPLRNRGKNSALSNSNTTSEVAEMEQNEENLSEEEYIEVTTSVIEENLNIKTTISNKNKKPQKKKLPSFTLMPGFAKGVLVTGGKIPVSFGGTNDPSPIFIRITGDQLIANDDSVNIDGCLIRATGKGDLSKRAVDVRLSSMSCNLVDLDGKRYKIIQNIQGWVFGENGEYGVSGRMITRESEIIKAGIPLSIVEGMINTLNNALSVNYSNTVSSGYLTAAPQQNLIQGAGKTGQNVLKKFSDYYIKMLDSLTPVISIRAGREVVIAFKGGENLQLQEYEPFSTNYFFKKDIEDENDDW